MANERYSFGPFEFDPERLRLRQGEAAVALPRKCLETLRVLVTRPGEVVSRQELFENVWAGCFVEDANLTVAISTLRRSLADFDTGNTYIQTVPTRGYRFVAPVVRRNAASRAALLIDRRLVERVTVTRRLTLGRANVSVAVVIGLAITITAGAAWMFKSPAAGSRASAATEAYARGKSLLEKRRVCESIPHLREALASDDSLGGVHADLASALAMCDITPEADTEIARARDLAPDSPDVLAVDGFLRMFRKWEWSAAETSLRRAVALDPANPRDHHWLGVYLSIRGWFNEAAAEMRRAVELEPDSPLYHADLAQVYYFMGDAERANAQANGALDLDPTFFFAKSYLRDVALSTGDRDAAAKYELERRAVMGVSAEELDRLRQMSSKGGFDAIIRDDIRALEKQRSENTFDPHGECGLYFKLGYNYALIRDRENSLAAFERALDTDTVSRPFPMAYIAADPQYAFLRGDDRFERILQRMGLRGDGVR